MVVWEVLTSTCDPDKNRISWEARRNPKELDITLEDKSAKGNI
jgi:succinate dehydrogenase flavin-adding protein (antitoxin of CptAB toxin-antitoxin module)